MALKFAIVLRLVSIVVLAFASVTVPLATVDAPLAMAVSEARALVRVAAISVAAAVTALVTPEI